MPALSPSGGSSFLDCPWAYREARIRKTPVVQRDYLTLGGLAHEAIQAYVDHLVRVRRDVDLQRLPAVWSEFVKTRKGEIPERLYYQTQRLLERFASKFRLEVDNVWKAEAKMAIDKHRTPVDWKSEDAHVRGIADLVTVFDGWLAKVRDWKTSWVAISEHNLRDNLQARTYALLVMCMNPSISEVQVEFVYPRSGTTVAAQFTRSDADDTFRRWDEIHHRVNLALETVDDEKKAWKPTPGKHCERCPVLLACPLSMATALSNAGIPTSQATAEELMERLLVIDAARKALRAGQEIWIDEQGAVIVKGMVLDHFPNGYDAAAIRKLAERHFIDPMRVLKVDADAVERVCATDSSFRDAVEELGVQQKYTLKAEPIAGH